MHEVNHIVSARSGCTNFPNRIRQLYFFLFLFAISTFANCNAVENTNNDLTKWFQLDKEIETVSWDKLLSKVNNNVHNIK